MVSVTKRVVKAVVPTTGINKLKQINNLFNEFSFTFFIVATHGQALCTMLSFLQLLKESIMEFFMVNLSIFNYSKSSENSSYLLRRNVHRIEKRFVDETKKKCICFDLYW